MQHAILAGIGIIAINTAWGGLYLNFVKPGLRWWLLAAGAVVLAMGVYGALCDDDDPASDLQEGMPERVTSQEPETSQDLAATTDPQGMRDPDGTRDPGGPHDHGIGHGPRIGWLLLVPFVVLSVVVPPPLGSFSAERDSGALRQAPAADASLPPLPVTPAPVTMTLSEYSVRAVYEKGKSLTTHRVRLVGFVSSRRKGGTEQSWYLTRMAMSCCAADGFAIKVDVRGGDRLPDDTWVEVTGRWAKSSGSIDAPDTLAALQVESIQPVTKPARPYEY